MAKNQSLTPKELLRTQSTSSILQGIGKTPSPVNKAGAQNVIQSAKQANQAFGALLPEQSGPTIQAAGQLPNQSLEVNQSIDPGLEPSDKTVFDTSKADEKIEKATEELTATEEKLKFPEAVGTSTELARQFQNLNGRPPTQDELNAMLETRKGMRDLEAGPEKSETGTKEEKREEFISQLTTEQVTDIENKKTKLQKQYPDANVNYNEATGEYTIETKDGTIVVEGGPTADDVAKVADASQTMLDEIETEVNTVFDNRLNQIDQALSNTINDIKAQYEKRRRLQEDLNKRTLGSLTKLGIRSGRQRFAQEIQTSILAAEERAGLARISDLVAEEQSLINQARAAADTNKFSVLVGKMDQLSKVREEKRQAFLDQMELAKQRSDEIANRAKAKRDELDFEIKLTEFNQKQADRMAGFVATGLIDLTEEGELLEPTLEEVQAAAEATNVPFFAMLGAVNERVDALRKVKGDEFGTTFERMKFQADEMHKEFQRDLDLRKDIREEELQEGKITLQDLEIGLKDAKLISEQAAAKARLRGEITPDQAETAGTLLKNVTGTQEYKDILDMRNGLMGIKAGIAEQNGVGDIAAMNNMQRLVDPGATVRSEDVELMKTAVGLLDKYNTKFWREKLEKGALLPDEVRQNMLDLATKLYDDSVDVFESSPSIVAINNQAEVFGIPQDYIGTDFQKTTDLRAYSSVGDFRNRVSDVDKQIYIDVKTDPAFSDLTDMEIIELINEKNGFSGDLSKSVKGQDVANAIAMNESGGNYDAVGKDGEIGKYQIMPDNYRAWAREANVRPSDTSPEAQDKIANYKINQYMDEFNGDPVAVAIAWNAGPGRAREYMRTGEIPQLVGVSAGGGRFDVPNYVKNVLNNLS